MRRSTRLAQKGLALFLLTASGAALVACSAPEPAPDRSNPFYLAPQPGQAPAAGGDDELRHHHGMSPGGEAAPGVPGEAIPGSSTPGDVPGNSGPGSGQPGNPLSGGGSMSFGAGGG